MAEPSIKYNWQTFYGNGNDPRGIYQLNVDVNGQNYEFIPDSVLTKGMVFDDGSGVLRQYYFPKLLTNETQKQIQDNAIRFDIGSNPEAKSRIDQMGATTTGILVPAGTVDIGGAKMYDITSVRGPIQGMGNTSEGPSYIMPANGAYGRYIAEDGKITTLTQTGGSSLLGRVLGGWVDNLTGALGVQDLANSVNDFFQTDVGKAVKLAALASNLSNIGTEGAGSEVGGVTGPDNIDVGGGFNPAGAAPITAETITQQISTPAAEQIAAEQASAQQFAAEQAAAQTAQQEAARIAAENAAYDQAMQDLAKNYVSPEFATSAAAQGLTFKQALDATRAGLLINAVTGDPLGLSDVGGSAGNNFAESGFAQVPIPEDWKSPTYTYSPVQNVTFEDLFPGVSLQGTQWQNMPQAQTFNEMFASGQQQTPMGSPVDINQIVGSILGQSATS
jgi:hypothetical protein